LCNIFESENATQLAAAVDKALNRLKNRFVWRQ